MTHKKINQLSKYKNIIIVGIIIVICLFVILVVKNFESESKSNYKTDFEQPASYDGSTSYITPTIFPSNSENKLVFKHPQNYFSFEYPKDWHIVLTRRNVSEPWYEVLLESSDKKNEFIIYFLNGGRDFPNYDIKEEYKTLGGRRIKWTTLSHNGEMLETFTNFPNNDFGNNLIGLYIYLPEENQEEFIKQVEEIITSLK